MNWIGLWVRALAFLAIFSSAISVSAQTAPAIGTPPELEKPLALIKQIIGNGKIADDIIDGIKLRIITVEFKLAAPTRAARLEAVDNGLSTMPKTYKNAKWIEETVQKNSLTEVTGFPEFTEENFIASITRVCEDAAALLPLWAKETDGKAPLNSSAIANLLNGAAYKNGPAAYTARFNGCTPEQRTKFITALNTSVKQLKQNSELNTETVRRHIYYIGAVVNVGSDPKNYDVSDLMNPKAIPSLEALNNNASNLLLLTQEIQTEDIPTILYYDPVRKKQVKTPLISTALLASNPKLFGTMNTVPDTLKWMQMYAGADIGVTRKEEEVTRKEEEVSIYGELVDDQIILDKICMEIMRKIGNVLQSADNAEKIRLREEIRLLGVTYADKFETVRIKVASYRKE